MSHWYSEFKSAFFTEWRRSGLPGPEPVNPALRAAWRAERCPLSPRAVLGQVQAIPPRADGRDPLHPEVLDSIYGFGVFIGRACGHLFGLDPETAGRRADWCGRLNLGVSLFDYVCDETPVKERRALLSLPAFDVFTGGPSTPPRDSLGDFMERLAEGVLQELAAEIGTPTAARRRYGLWRALFAMYAAQIRLSDTGLDARADLDAIVSALRLKSSEVFRVMAEWVARGARQGLVQPRRAAAFGRALGDCYWLVDDASDIWRDLDAGRWNWFLATAVAATPALDLAVSGPLLDVVLARSWHRGAVAPKRARAVTTRLARALRSLGAPPDQEHAVGCQLAASLLRWDG